VSDTDVRQPHPLISGVVEGSPADEAGLLPGDIVLAFNDVPVSTFENLQTQTRQHLGQNVELTIQRAGEERSISVVPRENPPPDEGAMGVQIWQADIVPAAGIVVAEGGPAQELVRLNVVESAEYAFNRIGFFLQTIAQLPGQILSGTADPAAVRLTGPLGIAQMGGLVLVESIEQSRPAIILEFIALISFALGLTNLLPIPALDGGRILFVLIEIVRGRPIAPEREGMVHLIGIALLLSLMVVVLFNDIRDPVVNQMR
jgi:regulator of sigma E protease